MARSTRNPSSLLPLSSSRSPPAMAAISDESFEEYNPHPYQGGYDIALTYGRPLGPSAAICYPISSSSPVSPAPPSPPASHKEEPAAAGGGGRPMIPRDSGISGVNRPADLGSNYRPGESEPFSSLFGICRFFFRGDGEGYDWRDFREEGFGYSLEGAADYVFGYLPRYGEKRDESHHYGNLNYAYERHRQEQPLAVQVHPDESSSRWQNVSYHEDYLEKVYEEHYEDPRRIHVGEWDGNHHHGDLNYAYEEHSPGQPLPVQDNFSDWWQNLSYHVDCQEQEFEGCSFEEPRSVDVEPDYLSWYQRPSYQGGVYPKSECVYAYERHHYEDPISVQIEPEENAWSEKLSFFEPYEEHVHPQPAYVYQHNHENQCDRHAQVDPLEPLFYERPSYYELYQEEFCPQSKWVDDLRETNEEQPYCLLHKYFGFDD